jgi:alpha-amylase
MKSICFYFQVHQPFRLRTYRFFDIGDRHDYYDDYNNRFIMQRVAEKCYLPMNHLLLGLIKEFGSAFKVTFSITGQAIEQFERYAPEVLDSFKKLAGTGNVEFLAETYAHSLASLKSADEFRKQVDMHTKKMEELFGQTPTSFRNTELIYSDNIGAMVADMGYEVMLTEGAKHVLGWKSPNFMYNNAINPKLKLLLKNYRLSDDIAFRYSQQSWEGWPLTTEKYVKWLKEIDQKEEVVNLYMDYETFGEHQWEETGIFEFMEALPKKILANTDFQFATPRELGEKLQPVSAIHAPYPISWADEERDLTAWLGNELQDEAFEKLYELQEKVNHCTDPTILADWQNLQTSDHFYYMCTKWFSDGDVHSYFNPYSSPYDAFINYMNVLSDFSIRVDENTTLESDDFDKVKKAASTFAKTTGKFAQGKTEQASKKVKEAIDKGKDMSFEDIKNMSNAKVKQLIREVDIEHLTGALKDAESELVDKIIPNMTKKAKKQYDELQEELKLKKSEVKKYRESVEKKIKDLFGK